MDEMYQSPDFTKCTHCDMPRSDLIRRSAGRALIELSATPTTCMARRHDRFLMENISKENRGIYKALTD